MEIGTIAQVGVDGAEVVGPAEAAMEAEEASRAARPPRPSKTLDTSQPWVESENPRFKLLWFTF